MTDLTDLKAKAEAATPGPWVTDDPNRELVARIGNDGCYEYIANAYEGDTWDQACRDAAFIAAANPQAILALIAEREADAAWMAEARRLFEAIRDFKPSPTERADPHTQIAVFAKDTARAFLAKSSRQGSLNDERHAED